MALDSTMASTESRSGREFRPRPVLLSLSLLLVGLALNRWSLGAMLAPDGEIEGRGKLLAIGILQGATILVGIGVLFRPPALPAATTRLGALVLLAVAALGGFRTWEVTSRFRRADEQVELLTAINRSEDLIQEISSWMGEFRWSALNLHFPDQHAGALFEDSVEYTDLASAPGEVNPIGDGAARLRHWPVQSTPRTQQTNEVRLWLPFFEQVDYFEHAKFYVVRGDFSESDEDVFVTEMGFDGLARLESGAWASTHAKLKVHWADHTPEDAKKQIWLVREWRTEEFVTTESDHRFFREVLDQLVPDATARSRARHSLQRDKILKHALDEGWEAPTWWTKESHDRHPGVAVVDLDRDGFDDLYVMARWGKNQFFHNNGDGTFSEIAAKLGLDIDGYTSSAIFIDLDNDGDSDAVLGRTLARSLILENEGGRFVDRSTEFVSTPLPFLVSSVSAVDYDGDGLLDVYFSTYAARMMHQELHDQTTNEITDAMGPEGTLELKADQTLLAAFLKRADAEELFARYQTAGHPILDRPGPPNMLLRNVGGGALEEASDVEVMRVWRNSYQATWADFDDDGDMDVYIANDFAMNNMIRNDGGGRFTDITEETKTADIGFGMGAAWGDYNNDGAHDLYVTNMFSKAGRRITGAVAALDPQFADCARGNSLFRQGLSTFDKVSGLADPLLKVEKAGWSWGGQFFDYDNDAYLDVYALSGHFTAPKEIAIPVDT